MHAADNSGDAEIKTASLPACPRDPIKMLRSACSSGGSPPTGHISCCCSPTPATLLCQLQLLSLAHVNLSSFACPRNPSQLSSSSPPPPRPISNRRDKTPRRLDLCDSSASVSLTLPPLPSHRRQPGSRRPGTAKASLPPGAQWQSLYYPRAPGPIGFWAGGHKCKTEARSPVAETAAGSYLPALARVGHRPERPCRLERGQEGNINAAALAREIRRGRVVLVYHPALFRPSAALPCCPSLSPFPCGASGL
ncbi:unnamed protein product [Urochloa decumbens]|uniref:Uncharacterized protein n=1 Tax=Urochloa decumbens TaxID=240449 RepID=A0ABC8XLW5_9POAL